MVLPTELSAETAFCCAFDILYDKILLIMRAQGVSRDVRGSPVSLQQHQKQHHTFDQRKFKLRSVI